MRILILIFYSFLCSNITYSNTTVLKYDTVIIKKTIPLKSIEEKVFSEVNVDFAKKHENTNTNLWQRFLNWFVDLFFSNNNIENTASATKTLFWVFVLTGIIIIIWVLTKIEFTKYFKQSSKNNAFNFNDIEEDITGINFNEKIQIALKDNNLRLAIRWQYLNQLNKLNEINLIIWQPYKTNIDYSNELLKTKYYNQFKDISKIYDYAWYGEYEITLLKYQSFEKQYIDFEKLIYV